MRQISHPTAARALSGFLSHSQLGKLPMNDTHQQEAADALDTVRALYRAGDLVAVRGLLALSLGRGPDEIEVTHLLGLLQAQWGEVDKAIATFESMFPVAAPTPVLRAVVHNDLGVLYHRQGRLQEALAAFHSALACDVLLESARENLASVQSDLQSKSLPDSLPTGAAVPTLLLTEPTLYKYRLRTLYQEAILACVQHRVPHWWDHPGLEDIFYCHSASLLRRLLVAFILRGAKDIATYRRLSHQLDAIGAEACEDAGQTEDCLSVVENRTPSAIPSAALMNGLLSLHAAETHPDAQARVPAIREAAREIWESASASIDAAADAEHMHQILRMLCHFDLLPEAQDCLSRYAPQGVHAQALSDWMGLRDINADYARGARSTGMANGVPHGVHSGWVVGITVWGHEYLRFFCHYHLPSVFAEGNLPALARRGKLWISIVTDAAGQAYIEQDSAYATLARLGEVHFTVVANVPDRTSAGAARTFYMRYGLLDHHHVYLARDLAANLLLLPTDALVSKDGYAALAEQIDEGYDCCSTASIEASRDALRPVLDAWRQEGVIAVDAAEFRQLAVRHKTASFKRLIVDPSTTLSAYPREFFWRVPGGYVCHSIFMHPIVLSARVLTRAFHANHENVDWALLPRLMQGDGRIKILDDSDRLFILQCSERQAHGDEASCFKGRITAELGSYLLSIHEHDFPVHRRLFQQPQFLPVEDEEVALAPRYLSDFTALAAMLDVSMKPYSRD